jgi:CorA-like Mg2+ transporter protein
VTKAEKRQACCPVDATRVRIRDRIRDTAHVPSPDDGFSAWVRRVAMIVDVASYVNGLRNAPSPLGACTARVVTKGGFARIGLYEPTEEEFVSVTGEFDLHKLAVEDAIKAHQRPKVERYGDSVFVVLTSARYLDSSRTVEFGEIHTFVGPDFIVTVRHGEASSLQGVRDESFARQAYRERNKIERLINRLKQWRRIAIRYEKRVRNYGGMLNLAVVVLWL